MKKFKGTLVLATIMLCSSTQVFANDNTYGPALANDNTHGYAIDEAESYTNSYGKATFDSIADFDITIVIDQGITDVEGYLNWQNLAMVNVDHLLKHLGYNSSVNQYASVVTSNVNGSTMTFVAGTTKVIINSVEYNVGSTIISDGRALYVPATEVLSLIGSSSEFNAHTKKLVITTNASTTQATSAPAPVVSATPEPVEQTLTPEVVETIEPTSVPSYTPTPTQVKTTTQSVYVPQYEQQVATAQSQQVVEYIPQYVDNYATVASLN